MKVSDLIEQLEQLDPDTLVLRGYWDSGRQEYVSLHSPDTIRNSLRVVRRYEGIRGYEYRDTDSGGGIDADSPEVLILC